MGAYDQEIYQALLGAGLNTDQAAAIMGNMIAESSLNPESAAMDSNGRMAYGLVSWNQASYPDANNLVTGNVQKDIQNQIAFLASSGAFAALGTGSAQQMASNFAHTYERCADCGYQGGSEQLAVRAGNAGQVLQQAQSGNWGTTGNSTADTTNTQQVGATGEAPQPPPLSNIPQLNQYIQQYYPQFAWMLNEPGVAQVIDEAIAGGFGGNTAYMQGQIENTEWWKTTSNAMRQYEQTLATTPGEVSFLQSGSQAQQMLAQVQQAAATQGVSLTGTQLQGIAQQALQFGWSAAQIDAAIGQDVAFAGSQNTNAGAITSQLQNIAGNFYQSPTSQALQSWAQGIAAGTQTVQQFEAQMQQDAALKWTGYAPQLMQGNNMVQLTDGLRNNIAQTLEIDPSSINFVSNPAYAKILDYVAPGDKTGVHRVMTQTEADQYIKSTPSFGFQNTQNARDATATLAQTIDQTFGKQGAG